MSDIKSEFDAVDTSNLFNTDIVLQAPRVQFAPSQKCGADGKNVLAIHRGFTFHLDRRRTADNGIVTIYWRCCLRGRCPARIKTNDEGFVTDDKLDSHNHSVEDVKRKSRKRKLKPAINDESERSIDSINNSSALIQDFVGSLLTLDKAINPPTTSKKKQVLISFLYYLASS